MGACAPASLGSAALLASVTLGDLVAMEDAVTDEGGTSPRSPRRRLALLILAVAHLGLVAMGAVKMHIPGHGWAKRALDEYRTLSGANVHYAFFAPGVDTQVRPVFELTDRTGSLTTDVLIRAGSSEVDTRIGNMVYLLDYVDEELQRALLAAWAGVMFTRHPGAERVVVRIEDFELPSMAEYRQDRRAGWQVRDRVTFSPQAAIRPVGDEANEASQ